MVDCIARRMTFVAVVLTFGSPAWCGDNLLGLPKPVDPQRPGAVVLHGGGQVTTESFDRFIELAGGKQAQVVFVPSAGYLRNSYNTESEFLAVISRRYGSWAALEKNGRVQNFQFLYTDNPLDADDAKFVKAIESATGVWFSGGFQSRLNYRYVGKFPGETQFQKALRGVVERGGVVGGTSAGMAIMPQIATLSDERKRADGPATAVAGHGFGMLNSAIVEQHFDGRGGRFERFTSLLRDQQRLDQLAGRNGAGAKMTGLAVEEDTALIARGDRLEVVGRGSAHVFLKSSVGRSIVWHELADGEGVELKRDTVGLGKLVYDAPIAKPTTAAPVVTTAASPIAAGGGN